MNEIRVAQKLQIKFNKNEVINGSVIDYTFDRVMIKIDDTDILAAKSLKELDDLYLIVATHLGIKYMYSSVISTINNNGCIIVENNKAVEIEQKREFARVVSNLHFVIEFNSKMISCVALNISAGGIAFTSSYPNFNINDKVKIKFSENDLGKNISCDAIIIKMNAHKFVAKYDNLNSHDEDKIMKYVFKLMK